jgi:hypothetical protein
MEPNGRVITTPPHVLQILDKVFEFCSSHVLPASFSLTVQYESYWHPTDKRECKIMFERGLRKFIDGSGKRIDGIEMLVGRAVKVCYDFPDEIPLLASASGQFR